MKNYNNEKIEKVLNAIFNYIYNKYNCKNLWQVFDNGKNWNEFLRLSKKALGKNITKTKVFDNFIRPLEEDF